VLPRVLDVHYPDQVGSGALREALSLYRLTPERYSFLVVNHRHGAAGRPAGAPGPGLAVEPGRLAEEMHRGPGPAHRRPLRQPAATALRSGRRTAAAGRGRLQGRRRGRRARAGWRPIRLSLLQVAGSRAAAAEGRPSPLDLRRAGLLLELITVDAEALLARLKQGDFDLAPMFWEGRPDDDPRTLFGPQGELAFTGYRSDGAGRLCSNGSAWPTGRRRAPRAAADRRRCWPPSSR
jgi:hypothetical protein